MTMMLRRALMEPAGGSSWTYELVAEQDGRVEKAKIPVEQGKHVHLEWDVSKLSDRTADTVFSVHQQLTWNNMNPNPSCSSYAIISGSINQTVYNGGYLDFDVPQNCNMFFGYWHDSDTGDRRITGDYIRIRIT